MENQDRTARGLDRRTFVAASAAAGALAVAAGASMARAEEAAEAEEAPAEEAAPAAGETLECDVCVVGCGAAGFMASITAAQNGAKVITLEKGDNITAPNGVYVSGPFAVDTDVLHNREGGTTLTVDDVFYHVMDYTHWTPNPSLMRKCLDASKDAVAVLEGIGYEFQEANFRFLTPFINEKGGFHLILTELEDRFTLCPRP